MTRAKRLVDVVLVVVAAVPAAIVVAGCVVAARLSGTGGNLLRSERAGLGGKPFHVWKIRSTTVDGRVTSIGRLLRRSGLDELPQLWNVARGEMSVVGPRPLTPELVDRYSPAQRRRLDVRPGLTGWAQVQRRSVRSWPESFELDVWYVDHTSLMLDARILVSTVAALVRRRREPSHDHADLPEFLGEHEPPPVSRSPGGG